MDIFYTEELGRMPFVLNDFRFLDKIYRSTFEAYLKMLSAENMILFGCIVTDNLNGTYTVSEGAVVINNEFYLCSSHTFPCDNINEAYFVVNQTADTEGLKKFGNNTMIDTYLLRRVLASQHASQPSDSINVSAYKFEDLYVKSGDTRLTDSRTCNNTFDNIESSRTNLDVYSKSETGNEIDTAINALINGAPGALDTLIELAAALGDDPNFAATITNALANKVDKDGAKVLSTNDFTDVLLAKLNGLNLPTSHAISFITGLQDALNGKSPVHSHTQYENPTSLPISFITGLQDALNGKSPTSHSHSEYANPTSHAISFITGLQDALNAKSSTSHNHISNNAWTSPTLGTNWTNHSFRYRVESNGVVHLNGIASPDSGASALMLTLPAGARPSTDLFFPVVTSGSHGYIHIYPNGTVYYSGDTNGNYTYFNARFLLVP